MEADDEEMLDEFTKKMEAVAERLSNSILSDVSSLSLGEQGQVFHQLGIYFFAQCLSIMTDAEAKFDFCPKDHRQDFLGSIVPSILEYEERQNTTIQ